MTIATSIAIWITNHALIVASGSAIAVFLVTLWRREYGLGAVILLWPAYLLRTSIAGVPTTALELSIYGLTAAWLGASLWRKNFAWPLLPGRIAILSGLWVLAWILSTIWSPEVQASLGAFKAWLIDPLIFGLLLLFVIRTAPQRAIILGSLALSGAIVAIGGLTQLKWFRDTLQDGRLSSFFHPVANYAAMFLAPILVLTIGAILWQKLSRRWWWAAIAMLIALALTVSFGGYLSVGVGVLMLWWKLPDQKMKRQLFVGGLLVAIIGGVILSTTPYLKEKFNTTDRSSSLVRTQIWRTSWEMIKEHPIVGIGPNTFEPVYRATIPKLYFPPLEWLVAQPHQLYLALWLETGLLGLLTFLIFIILWFKHLWARVRENDAVAIISVAAMLAILAHGFVDTPLFKNDLMMVFVFVATLPFLKKD